MGSVSESLTQRITLESLASRYGLSLEPAFAAPVTVTSLTDDLDDVRPGALYMPLDETPTANLVGRALDRGAYAMLAPAALRGGFGETDIPVLYGDLTDAQVGQLASWVAGNPSESLAMFAVCGPQAAATVTELADFLHVLGNPVTRVSVQGSYCLDRRVELRYPLDALQVQHVLSVGAEDGAAAAVICLDDATLKRGSVSGMSFDVLAVADDTRLTVPTQRKIVEYARRNYGFALDDNSHVASRTSDSDAMARQVDSMDGEDPSAVSCLSTAIAMVMAAGVKRSNIRSALRVSRELR